VVDFSTPIARTVRESDPLSNLIELFLIFAVSAGLTYTLGRMTGSLRHGWAVWMAKVISFPAGVLR
jgi:potassium-transporting ATPase potassium-binding subunit